MSENRASLESYTPHRTVILKELGSPLSTVNEAEVAVAQRVILRARRVFVTGAGRRRRALKMAAMRLMHLGLTVHVAGEVTAPAIGPGDLLTDAMFQGMWRERGESAEELWKRHANLE